MDSSSSMDGSIDSSMDGSIYSLVDGSIEGSIDDFGSKASSKALGRGNY